MNLYLTLWTGLVLGGCVLGCEPSDSATGNVRLQGEWVTASVRGENSLFQRMSSCLGGYGPRLSHTPQAARVTKPIMEMYYYIFALKMKFCVNSLYFLFRLRKKYEWIIGQRADSDKAHWQPALPVSTTSILYCVFISPFHLLSAPQCNGEMAPFAIFLNLLSQKNESVARALVWICCKVSLPPELGGMRGRIKNNVDGDIFFKQHTPKKINHPVSASPCAFICLWPKPPFEAGCVSQHVEPLLPRC